MTYRKRILTLGTFDMLHRGHKTFLKECASMGELTVAVNTDDYVRRFKSPPSDHELQRLTWVKRLPYVTDALLNEGDNAHIIELISPDILAIGSDWARRDYYAQLGITQDFLDQHGITLAYIPYTWGISTTEIRNGLLHRDRTRESD